MTPVAYLYGDYACPHTYLVDERLSLLASEGMVSVAWRPTATYGTGTADDWRALSGDGTPLEVIAEDLSRSASQLGLTLLLPPVPPATSLALQASEFARDCGEPDWHRLHKALFRAVFVDGIDIGSSAELLDVAESARIDRVGLQAALDDGRYLQALVEAEEEANRYGIDATPTVIIDRSMVVGSAPLEVLREMVRR
jgi:predicted DsbA family dithiol-disulfide isomerase